MSLKDADSLVEKVHTLVHEIGHWIAGKSGLNERAAEKLIKDWGFQEESDKVQYDRPIDEEEGYKCGWEWASNLADGPDFYLIPILQDLNTEEDEDIILYNHGVSIGDILEEAGVVVDSEDVSKHMVKGFISGMKAYLLGK